jgi:hypothetical protein
VNFHRGDAGDRDQNFDQRNAGWGSPIIFVLGFRTALRPDPVKRSM